MQQNQDDSVSIHSNKELRNYYILRREKRSESLVEYATHKVPDEKAFEMLASQFEANEDNISVRSDFTFIFGRHLSS